MMQKRTIYSLLLTSFILVCAFSFSTAQTVEFESKTVLRCDDGVLNVTVDPGSDIRALEVVFQIESTSGGAFFTNLGVNWDPAFTVLTNRYIDLSGVDYTSPDLVRVAAVLTDAADACLPAGVTDVAQVSFTTNDVCEGQITLSGGVFTCEPTPGYTIEAQTQFVDCASNDLVAAAVTNGVITVTNQAPTMQPIADVELPFTDQYTGQIDADDGDLPNGCEALTYSKVDGPADLTVDANTGAIAWNPTGADVCEHEVTVRVDDLCGGFKERTFTICVTNEAPILTCPGADEAVQVSWGQLASGSVSATDPDGGPSVLDYDIVDIIPPTGAPAPPTMPTIDNDGNWEWQTQKADGYLGIFEIVISVTDGANVCDPCSPENADTCSVFVHVRGMTVIVEKTHDAYQGQDETVAIYVDTLIDPTTQIGGYDLLLQYDQSALVFNYAEPGTMLTTCGWEYFTYRYGANGNCGVGPCPSGVVRLNAIAETNNGANHPSCFMVDEGDFEDRQLARLNFLVTNDYTFECQYVPIRWVWYDCGDNAFSDVTGDTLLISREVYEFEDGIGMVPVSDPDGEFPSWYGANNTCDTANIEGFGKNEALRAVDFWHGGVDIICKDSIDATADINLNEIPYEIADAVLYSNYFVYGLAAFHINIEGQIAASDVNGDGITLSVADLVYLIRVIRGDAFPNVKVSGTVEANYVHTPSGVLRVTEDVEMGGMLAIFDGNVTPELLADGMELKYNFDGANTRVLVYSLDGNSFTGEVVKADAELTSIELASAEGTMVDASLVPTEYQLNQNYPNPFNPTTTISFSVEETSDYTLTIYNVNGQKVTSFSGTAVPGQEQTVEWNASSVASGVYFYKLDAGVFSETKKMVLLK
jgi:hypothetical protein